MKRIGILTAGGDTPALNATIYGAVERANQLNIEVVGFFRGYAGLLDDRVPHVHLNPLFSTIPEIDPTEGGTLIGSSRTYIDRDSDCLDQVRDNLAALKIDGLICVGGDGTINGMQPLADFLPCVLAPKTIDNDLGLNYLDEANDWVLARDPETGQETTALDSSRDSVRLENMINYVTPGYATAVYVVTQSIQRIRTTAESHRRIAIVEVMGRQSGFIALGAAYGQPDIILLPEVPLDLEFLEDRIRHLYDRQRHVVIVIGEGVRDSEGHALGAVRPTMDPGGNIVFSGAAECLKSILAEHLGEEIFLKLRTHEPASAALFTRKIGHTQRGGRPIQFDRFHAAQLGGKAVDLLVDGENNEIATLQYSPDNGFTFDHISANKLRDTWGDIHPRTVHPCFYDGGRFQPSGLGIEYLKPIFTRAIGADDVETIRHEMFSPGNLAANYQSVNVDLRKRIRYVR